MVLPVVALFLICRLPEHSQNNFEHFLFGVVLVKRPSKSKKTLNLALMADAVVPPFEGVQSWRMRR